MARLQSISRLILVAALGGGCNTTTVEHTADTDGNHDDGELGKLAFDAGTIQTLKGTVIRVDPFQRISGSRHGLRLRLRVDNEMLYVYLGPERYLAKGGITLKPEDEVEVVGSVLPGNGRRVMIAAAVSTDSTSVQLRDEEGRPLWRRWVRWSRS